MAYFIGGVVGVAVGLYWLVNPVTGPREKSVAVAEPRGDRKPVIGTAAYAIAAGLSLALVVVLGFHETWKWDILAGLVVLAVVITPLAIEREEESINGIPVIVVLAACVLGPAQAACVGLTGIAADFVWYRVQTGHSIRRRAGLNNVLTYSLYPVVAGLIAGVVVSLDHGIAAFIGAVTVVYAGALLANVSLTALFSWSEDGQRFKDGLSVGPTFWAEILAAELSAFGVFALEREGVWGLAIAGGTLVVFLRLAKRFFESVDNAEVAEHRRIDAEYQRALVAYGQRFTIVKIMHALAAKDPSTARHSAAVSGYMRAFATHLKLEPADVVFCAVAGLLHDNGKLSVPESILTKPGRLTDEEMTVIKHHAQDGADFVRDLDGFGDISDVIVAHHERWDGAGYPNGLKGEDIPPISMMINICDAYDVLTSRSLYSEPKPHDVVIDILLGDRGTILSEYLVNEFVAMMEARDDLRYDPDQGDGFQRELDLFLGERPSDTSSP